MALFQFDNLPFLAQWLWSETWFLAYGIDHLFSKMICSLNEKWKKKCRFGRSGQSKGHRTLWRGRDWGTRHTIKRFLSFFLRPLPGGPVVVMSRSLSVYLSICVSVYLYICACVLLLQSLSKRPSSFCLIHFGAAQGWKPTFGGRWPLMEDDLNWKKTTYREISRFRSAIDRRCGNFYTPFKYL